MKKVLFVCVGNSGRSQMAETFTKKLSNGAVDAESAGTHPSGGMDMTVVEAMKEIGFDMSGQHPKSITRNMVESADKIISMGCGVNADLCPVAFMPAEDWGLEDPHGEPIEKVREIRDEIKQRVELLLEEFASKG